MIMNNDWNRCGWKQLWYNLSYCPSFCVKGVRETTRNPQAVGVVIA
jgi:hypothetical protein